MENKRPFKTIYTCFPQGKHKVLTMSYDDGKIFDRKLIEIFNKYGIKGTFHLNTGIMPVDEDRIQLSEVKELYKGHEVSCHTSTHPTIERCPLDQVVQQVIEDRKALEDAVGYPVRGLSYPNGSYSKDIINLLPACGIDRVSAILGVKEKSSKIFISGFFGNAILAAFLAYIGDRLGVPLYYAAIFTFGGRLFENFATIRRLLLFRTKQKQ